MSFCRSPSKWLYFDIDLFINKLYEEPERCTTKTQIQLTIFFRFSIKAVTVKFIKGFCTKYIFLHILNKMTLFWY